MWGQQYGGFGWQQQQQQQWPGMAQHNPTPQSTGIYSVSLCLVCTAQHYVCGNKYVGVGVSGFVPAIYSMRMPNNEMFCKPYGGTCEAVLCFLHWWGGEHTVSHIIRVFYPTTSSTKKEVHKATDYGQSYKHTVWG